MSNNVVAQSLVPTKNLRQNFLYYCYVKDVCIVELDCEGTVESIFNRSMQSVRSKFNLNVDSSNLLDCFKLFYEFTLSPSYDTILNACVDRFNFMKFFLLNESDLSLVTVCKSLIFYSSRHGSDVIFKHLETMIELEKDICLQVNNFNDMAEFISNADLSKYFIVDVLEEYYELVRNIHEF